MRPGLVALIAVVAVAVAGCGADGAGDGRATVFAAASLTEVLRTVDPDARFNFAGSDQLAYQITQGAPADVFASASARQAGALRAEGLVDEPRVFATNRVVVIVPRANPAGIGRITDLALPGVKLVVGEPGVPIGAYTRTALAALGLERALENVVSEERDVKAVVTKVALGEADAGLAYLTDVEPVADRVRALPIPDAAQPEVRYVVALVPGGPRPAAGRAFIAALLGAPGRAALADAGFGLPEA